MLSVRGIIWKLIDWLLTKLLLVCKPNRNDKVWRYSPYLATHVMKLQRGISLEQRIKLTLSNSNVSRSGSKMRMFDASCARQPKYNHPCSLVFESSDYLQIRRLLSYFLYPFGGTVSWLRDIREGYCKIQHNVPRNGDSLPMLILSPFSWIIPSCKTRKPVA